MPSDLDVAPNFSGEYPGAGELIGPAWRAAWRRLAVATDWVPAAELVATMTRTVPVATKTAEGLLGSARRAGGLQVRYGNTRRGHRGRNPEYQISTTTNRK